MWNAHYAFLQQIYLQQIYFTETFSLDKHMLQAGFAKFDPYSMDIYRFLNTFEKGCEKLKYNGNQMMATLLFFLERPDDQVYLDIRVHNNPSEWKDFRSIFVKHYHSNIYDRYFKYLSQQWQEGSLYKFAKKKSEVLRKCLKATSESDLIQIITWSLPTECQQEVMPKLFSNINSFLNFLQNIDAKNEAEKGEEEQDTANEQNQNQDQNQIEDEEKEEDKEDEEDEEEQEEEGHEISTEN